MYIEFPLIFSLLSINMTNFLLRVIKKTAWFENRLQTNSFQHTKFSISKTTLTHPKLLHSYFHDS